MKKLFITLAIVLATAVSANAQWWIGGSANAAINDDIDFKVAPEIGYNINSHWAVATGLAYRFVKDNTYNVTANQFIVSPYVRYIGGTIGKKFSLFCDLTGDIDVLSPQMYRIGIQPGIAWMATEKFTAAFRFAFAGYDHYYENAPGFYMNFALAAPTFGLYYNF